jgi:hypothetical protein
VDDDPITKWRDLNLDDIGKWCLQENDTTCECSNPLMPIHRHGHKTWTEAHMQNIKLARDYLRDMKGKSILRVLDVVFLGDSITEGWRGTSFGKDIEEKRENIEVFHEFFDTENVLYLSPFVFYALFRFCYFRRNVNAHIGKRIHGSCRQVCEDNFYRIVHLLNDTGNALF